MRARVPFPEYVHGLDIINGSFLPVLSYSVIFVKFVPSFFIRPVSHFPVIRRFRPRFHCPFVFAY